MARIDIPEDLKGKELFKFLIDNKTALVAQKKSMLKHADVMVFDALPIKTEAVKSTDNTNDNGICSVKVVANTAWYCDSQMDVLLPDNAKKSISERKGLIPHLHDHVHEIGAQVGDVKNIYYQTMSLSELGINKIGSTQVLVFETDIKKSYNEQVYNLYKAGRIKQHSIGLQYVKMGLAINDEESVAEYELWQKYQANVINQDIIQEKGFFWVVPEIKLLENSAVLFGSNPITPTLSAKQDDTTNEPSDDTQEQPLKFDMSKAIKQVSFFNNKN
jgi:hypothetical protein